MARFVDITSGEHLPAAPGARVLVLLSYEEDAWCRPEPAQDSVEAIKAYLHSGVVERHPGTALADEEDAWTRPQDAWVPA